MSLTRRKYDHSNFWFADGQHCIGVSGEEASITTTVPALGGSFAMWYATSDSRPAAATELGILPK